MCDEPKERWTSTLNPDCSMNLANFGSAWDDQMPKHPPGRKAALDAAKPARP